MKMPLVSIVMPTLNSARFIRETIHSLIYLNYKNFELIVVDGGSTDGTIQIVQSYMGDGDLRLIILEPRLGIARALNEGFSAAKGEFIARMDADDIAYSWRIDDQVNFLISNSEVDLVGTGVDNFGLRSGSGRSPFTHSDIVDMYLINNPFYHPTIMIRRTLMERGLYKYDENQVCDEDYELWGRLIPDIICANMDQSSIKYRAVGGSAQWDPRRHLAKVSALRGFCSRYGILNENLIEALAEFQCSGFLRYESYILFCDYANRAEVEGLPRLGWIHKAILNEASYPDFLAWFRRAKGWPV